MSEENPIVLSLQNPESIAICEDIQIKRIECNAPDFGTFFFKVTNGRSIHHFPFVFSSLIASDEIPTLPYNTNYITSKEDFFTITLIASTLEADPELWTELSYDTIIKIYWEPIQ